MQTDNPAPNTSLPNTATPNTEMPNTSTSKDTPTPKPWFEEIAIPALLRHARTTYGVAMRKALEEAGYDDMPKNGMYVIGGMALETGAIPLGQLIEELGISKQTASQLVDTLVTRGYLQRTEDSNDRRKLTITLTVRGRDAAATQREARKKIDAALIECVGQESVSHTRRTLAALVGIGHHGEERDDG